MHFYICKLLFLIGTVRTRLSQLGERLGEPVSFSSELLSVNSENAMSRKDTGKKGKQTCNLAQFLFAIPNSFRRDATESLTNRKQMIKQNIERNLVTLKTVLSCFSKRDNFYF